MVKEVLEVTLTVPVAWWDRVSSQKWGAEQHLLSFGSILRENWSTGS